MSVPVLDVSLRASSPVRSVDCHSLSHPLPEDQQLGIQAGAVNALDLDTLPAAFAEMRIARTTFNEQVPDLTPRAPSTSSPICTVTSLTHSQPHLHSAVGH